MSVRSVDVRFPSFFFGHISISRPPITTSLYLSPPLSVARDDPVPTPVDSVRLKHASGARPVAHVELRYSRPLRPSPPVPSQHAPVVTARREYVVTVTHAYVPYGGAVAVPCVAKLPAVLKPPRPSDVPQLHAPVQPAAHGPDLVLEEVDGVDDAGVELAAVVGLRDDGGGGPGAGQGAEGRRAP